MDRWLFPNSGLIWYRMWSDTIGKCEDWRTFRFLQQYKKSKGDGELNVTVASQRRQSRLLSAYMITCHDNHRGFKCVQSLLTTILIAAGLKKVLNIMQHSTKILIRRYFKRFHFNFQCHLCRANSHQKVVSWHRAGLLIEETPSILTWASTMWLLNFL